MRRRIVVVTSLVAFVLSIASFTTAARAEITQNMQLTFATVTSTTTFDQYQPSHTTTRSPVTGLVTAGSASGTATAVGAIVTGWIGTGNPCTVSAPYQFELRVDDLRGNTVTLTTGACQPAITAIAFVSQGTGNAAALVGHLAYITLTLTPADGTVPPLASEPLVCNVIYGSLQPCTVPNPSIVNAVVAIA